MASTYVNDLRLNEMATGDGSGTWGTTTNTNLELIAEAFSYGTEAITTNADTHTTTIADGATDPGRSLYLKYTGTLDSACTITIGPNTVSKVWIVENGTSGSQDIILSQGSGANITIPAGDTKVVYSDGAGAGAAFVDAFANLKVTDPAQTNITSVGTLTGLTVNGNVSIDGGTIKLDGNYPTGTDNVALGNAALDSITSGAGNIAIGDSAATALTTGSNAIAIGRDAMSGAVFTGSDAVAVGRSTLAALTSGSNNVAVGALALNANTTAANNTAVGFESLVANTEGANNVAVGKSALGSNTTASNNVAIGQEALYSNTTGSENTAVGRSALVNNVSGSSNAAIAYGALNNNTEGAQNVAIGRSALAANTTASNNTAVGYASLFANTTGDQNTAVGSSALVANTEGAANTAMGVYALQDNTTGVHNTGVGYLALGDNTEGNYNTGFGMYTVRSNTTASNNTGIGYQALYLNTTGDNNTAVGYQSLVANTTGTGNTALGYGALDANTTANYSTAVGYNALTASTGTYNTSLGQDAGSQVTTGTHNVYIGAGAGSNNINTTTGGSNTLVGTFSDTTASDSSNVNVLGYNVDGASGYTTLGVGADDIRAAHGNITWATVSDVRVKKDIEDSTVGLNFINDLRPVTFNYKNKGDLPKEFRGYEEGSTEVYKSEKTQHGFIAQEVKSAIDKNSDIKNGFSMWDDDDDTGQQRVGETALVPVLVKAIQELSAQNAELTTRITALEG
jgi:trimeric autotransporter adhesin